MPTSAEQFQDALYGIGTSPFDIGSTPDFKLMYQTAFGAQWLALVENLEALLGYVPNISDPATLNTLVQAGVIDQATAQKLGDLNAPVFSKTGTLNANFARRGGARALEGPFLAQQAEVLKGFQKALQMASLQSVNTGMNFGLQTRGQNIQALQAGGNQAVGLRQAEAAGGHELSPEDLARLQPPQPTAPKEPSFWDRNGGAIIGAGLAGLAPLARDYFRSGSSTPFQSTVEPPPSMPQSPQYSSTSDYLRSFPYDYSGGGYSYSQPMEPYYQTPQMSDYYDPGYGGRSYSYTEPQYSYDDYYGGYNSSYADPYFYDYTYENF